MKPIALVNLKTYQQGKDAIKLINEIIKVDKNVIIGVQATDICEAAKVAKQVYVQHVDYFQPGRYTGFVLPEAVKKNGATGAFLNHSEHRLKMRVIKKTIERCKEVGLKTAVFAATLREAKKIKKMNPDYIIIEPPELVAGDLSVSKAKPELIENVAKKLKMPFLVGAGIKTAEDVRIAMKLGASGFGVSSAITKAKNPGKVLRELIK
jgi:triosephosphate isomerase (TIM)